MAERQLTAVLVASDGGAVGFVVADGSMVALTAVVEDVRLGRHGYMVAVADSCSALCLVDDDENAYAGLQAIGATEDVNLVDQLPRQHHELRHELDAALPIRPEPVKVASWRSGLRPAVVVVLALIGFSALLLLRPVSWNALGGEQNVADVAVLPRMNVIFVPVAVAITAAVLTRLLTVSGRWTRFIGIAGIALLGVGPGQEPRPTPPRVSDVPRPRQPSLR